jgi:hypothetical protein
MLGKATPMGGQPNQTFYLFGADCLPVVHRQNKLAHLVGVWV